MSTGLKLKVCGMREGENIQAVAALQPDYMGFIFFPGSKRFVGEDFAISTDFPAGVKRVGVFVNEQTEQIAAMVRKHGLDLVQLHGTESPGQCHQLRAGGVKVIKAFAVDEKFDFKQLLAFKPVVDYFLFDSTGKEAGGNGVRFDWSILRLYDQEIPFFLAGGLSPSSADELLQLRRLNLHAWDINSGVETSPGLKNIQLVKEMIQLKNSSHEV